MSVLEEVESIKTRLLTPTTDLRALKRSLAGSFAQIHHTLSQFEHHNPKLLALLREAAGSQAVLLNQRTDHTLAQLLLDPRPAYPLLGKGTPLKHLTHLAESQRFELLTQPTEYGTTLSLGGSCLVVDIDLDPSSAVTRCSFSYSYQDAQYKDPKLDAFLLAHLAELHLVTPGSGTPMERDALEQRVELGLQEVQRTLRELKTLDDQMSTSGGDLFMLLREVGDTLGGASTTGELQLESGIGWKAIYHLSPPLPAPVLPTLSALDLADFLDSPNVHRVRVGIDSHTAQGGALFRASFEPKVIIGKVTGRKLVALLEEDMAHVALERGTAVDGIEDMLLRCSTLLLQEREMEYTHLNPGKVAGFRLEHLRFRTTGQLLAALAILREQLVLNTLFTNLFPALPTITPSTTPSQHISSLARPTKRPKLDPKPLTLEELLSPMEPSKVRVDVVLEQEEAGIVLSFPATHTAPSRAYPVEIRIQYQDIDMEESRRTLLVVCTFCRGELEGFPEELEREARLEERETQRELGSLVERSGDVHSLVVRVLALLSESISPPP